MRRALLACLLLAAVGPSLSGCRLLTKTVACERDRDCPVDAGIPFCTRWTDWDAGVGVCVGDPEARGDIRAPDEGDAGTDDPDGGLPFGDGGLPFLP